MELSHLCVENAVRLSRLEEIGELMRRIVVSFGIVYVVLILNIRDH
jgi:hypothetical protein